MILYNRTKTDFIPFLEQISELELFECLQRSFGITVIDLLKQLHTTTVK